MIKKIKSYLLIIVLVLSPIMSQAENSVKVTIGAALFTVGSLSMTIGGACILGHSTAELVLGATLIASGAAGVVCGAILFTKGYNVSLYDEQSKNNLLAKADIEKILQSTEMHAALIQTNPELVSPFITNMIKDHNPSISVKRFGEIIVLARTVIDKALNGEKFSPSIIAIKESAFTQYIFKLNAQEKGDTIKILTAYARLRNVTIN